LKENGLDLHGIAPSENESSIVHFNALQVN